MSRIDFLDVFTFYVEFLYIGWLLDFDWTAVRGSHAFLIFNAKMVASENLVLPALKVSLRDGDI